MIRDVMSTEPVAMSMSTSLHEAAKAMRDQEIGDVIVLDDSDQICGIVTDRDIVVRALAEGKEASETLLGEICSRDVETVAPDDSVGDVVRLMSEKAIRRVPVVEGGRPVGIVSIGDLATTQDPESALADISSAPPNN
jgi:CBS domain-containing protein